MTNNKYIKEALQFQELTEEEKQKRGILARLYGPCASVIAPTRNGRLYNDELWEKVFTQNEIVKEMFANGGVPLEMDHPVDREETCSDRIAAMLPEAPKRDKDGHLICYVDIIDTPLGKIAYQLAKYGFKLGISSRGTGDLTKEADGTESVDPDTYDFTTFDLVLLPAVKDARLVMCEGYDTKMAKFKTAIKESLATASEEERRIMNEALTDLNMPVEAETAADAYEHTIPDVADVAPDLLLRESKDDSEEKDPDEVTTVQDLIDLLGEYDPDANIKFETITIDNKNYAVDNLAVDDTVEDDIVLISFDYVPEGEDDNTDDQEDKPEDEDNDADEADVEPAETEIDDETDEADDVEINGIIDSLKEAIRQKDALEKELKAAKSTKTVGDAEVKKLKEDLERYKSAFARTSELAINAKKFESEVKSLTETLNKKEARIKTLENEKTNTVQLTESRDANAAKVKVLTEKLQSAKNELEAAETKLNEQAVGYRKQLQERTNLAKQYKTKFQEALDKYVGFRASMLGVRPTEILNKLDEQFTIDDVDQVVDRMLTEGATVNRLNSFGTPARVKINESKKPANSLSYDLNDGYEIDDDLLKLAGLK